MSRSYRHTPVFGFTKARSDKPFKKEQSRLFRAKNGRILAKSLMDDVEATFIPFKRDSWGSCKDGKYWSREATALSMAK